MENYEISDDEIKLGDYAINTEYPKSEPKLVEINSYGYLGFNQKGWFS